MRYIFSNSFSGRLARERLAKYIEAGAKMIAYVLQVIGIVACAWIGITLYLLVF
jgi:hypothetical protein